MAPPWIPARFFSTFLSLFIENYFCIHTLTEARNGYGPNYFHYFLTPTILMHDVFKLVQVLTS